MPRYGRWTRDWSFYRCGSAICSHRTATPGGHVNKKLIALGLGTSAAALAALITAGTASSDPAAESPYNVVGEPYGRAVQILAGAGMKATFGGAVGSDMQQSLCVVEKQKFTSNGRVQLMLNC